MMKTILTMTMLAVMIMCSTAVYAQTTEELARERMRVVEEALRAGDCERAQTNYDVWRNLTGRSDANIASRINNCFAGRQQQQTAQQRIDRNAARANSPFFQRGHNSYFAWTVLGGGFPFNASMSFQGRHGGIMGIGYFLTLGAEWGTDDEVGRTEWSGTHLHYSAGIKFFPYKNFFLSAGFGTFGVDRTYRGTDGDMFGRGRSDIWEQRQGMMFTAGKSIPLESLRRSLRTGGYQSGMFLSFGAGMGLDQSGNLHPLINLRFLGFAWGAN